MYGTHPGLTILDKNIKYYITLLSIKKNMYGTHERLTLLDKI